MRRQHRAAAREESGGTYRDLDHSIHARPRGGLDGEHDGVERDLLELPEDVEAEARDDNGGDVHTACACLDSLEDDQAKRGYNGGEPRQKMVDCAPDERCN